VKKLSKLGRWDELIIKKLFWKARVIHSDVKDKLVINSLSIINGTKIYLGILNMNK